MLYPPVPIWRYLLQCAAVQHAHQPDLGMKLMWQLCQLSKLSKVQGARRCWNSSTFFAMSGDGLQKAWHSRCIQTPKNRMVMHHNTVHFSLQSFLFVSVSRQGTMRLLKPLNHSPRVCCSKVPPSHHLL